jgi:hypothetical protein
MTVITVIGAVSAGVSAVFWFVSAAIPRRSVAS